VKHANYTLSLPVLWTAYLTVFEKSNDIETKNWANALKLDRRTDRPENPGVSGAMLSPSDAKPTLSRLFYKAF